MPARFVSPFDPAQVRDLFQTAFRVRHCMLTECAGEVGSKISTILVDAPMVEAVRRLQEDPLLRVLDGDLPVGWIHGDCLNSPTVRMWLFGLLSILDRHEEMALREIFPGDSWIPQVSDGRLEAARRLQEERQRLGQPCDLFSCLQLADKTRLLIEGPLGEKLGYTSRRARKQAVKALGTLRNQLAHHQEIFPLCAETIFGIVHRAEELLGGQRLERALASPPA